MRTKEELRGALERRIAGYGPRALVAHSGGVDSSLVLALSVRALGAWSVTAVTAVSPSLAVSTTKPSSDRARLTSARMGSSSSTMRMRHPSIPHSASGTIG